MSDFKPQHHPVFIQADDLAALLDAPDLLIVDLGTEERYVRQHIPGAVHLPYSAITRDAPPVSGLMPEPEALGAVLSAIGYEPSRRIVAYDDSGGGKAGRLLFTLHALGEDKVQILDGGLGAWAAAGLDLTDQLPTVRESDFTAEYRGDNLADHDSILAAIKSGGAALIDTRGPAEYSGDQLRAMRGGHIPGAVSYDWVRAMDPRRQQRLKPLDEIRAELAELGVTPDKPAIVYCQTHHRSAHTYAVLKALGFDQVHGYPGAWSEWGNDAHLPIATGPRPGGDAANR